MKLQTRALNKYIIGIPHQIEQSSGGLVLNNHDTECLIKVHSVPEGYGFEKGEFLWCDINYMREYVIAGEKYIVIDIPHVISKVTGVQR